VHTRRARGHHHGFKPNSLMVFFVICSCPGSEHMNLYCAKPPRRPRQPFPWPAFPRPQYLKCGTRSDRRKPNCSLSVFAHADPTDLAMEFAQIDDLKHVLFATVPRLSVNMSTQYGQAVASDWTPSAQHH